MPFYPSLLPSGDVHVDGSSLSAGSKAGLSHQGCFPPAKYLTSDVFFPKVKLLTLSLLAEQTDIQPAQQLMHA